MTSINLNSKDFEMFEAWKKDMEKKFAEACKQANMSADNFQTQLNNTLDLSIKKFILDTSQIIETKSIPDQTLLYKTTISALGSTKNEFPPQPPSSDDLYWKTHKEQVDNALAMRKELLLKIVEIASSAVTGLVGIISPAK